MSLGIRYKDERQIFREIEKEVPYLEYPLLTDTKIVHHGFSTRLGGVSQGCYASMNLSFTRGDDEAAVRENYHRIAKSIGVKCENMVLSQQTHTTNVRVVTEKDKGKGIVKPLDYTDVDGRITNVPGIVLVTSYADCVPLYFVDPIRKVIGLSHSGWRGTVGKIGKHTVELMQETFGCRPEEILAAVGPSVCMDCYEVSEEVIDKFREAFDKENWEQLFYKKANELIFLESGILAEHMAITNVCTHCNSEILYSHRTMGNKRGNLCAFLALK